jgi:sec-independent protein translocase protein TatC
MGIDPDPRISDWLTFVLILPLGFGIGFQLPLVMLFLERIGIFNVAAYVKHWRISVLVICVLSMILTPSDPYSMILMAVPLVCLYFLGIAMCRMMARRTTPFGERID